MIETRKTEEPMPATTPSQTKIEITHAAWRQFRTSGYHATTYASVAKDRGIGRSLVQYHFPRKEELPISLVSWALEQSEHCLGANVENAIDDHVAFYKIGVCTFTFLLDGGFSRFLREMLESRAITEALLAMNIEWALAHTDSEFTAGKEEVVRTVITNMGGFYDYLYHCLSAGKKFNVADCLATSVYASATALAEGQHYSPADFHVDEKLAGEIRTAANAMSERFEALTAAR